jgi:hypothetical protein
MPDRYATFRGADIEIFEAVDQEPSMGVIKPNRIRINGQEIITTQDGEITVEPLRFKKDVVVVTISKIICRSLTFRPEIADASE